MARVMDPKHRETNGVKEKHCAKCEAWLPQSNFHKNRTKPDGLQNYCKQCQCDAVATSAAKVAALIALGR